MLVSKHLVKKYIGEVFQYHSIFCNIISVKKNITLTYIRSKVNNIVKINWGLFSIKVRWGKVLILLIYLNYMDWLLNLINYLICFKCINYYIIEKTMDFCYRLHFYSNINFAKKFYSAVAGSTVTTYTI